MRVRNVHERVLAGPVPSAAPLIDRLASGDDVLWPRDRWPRMAFDRPLAVGARGGHGPIRYTVEGYRPGVSVTFRFSAPRGFDGTHGFDLRESGDGRSLLRNVLEMEARGGARWTWVLVFRPLHDALMEDAMDNAERFLGGRPARRRWSLQVRALRRLLAGRARRR